MRIDTSPETKGRATDLARDVLNFPERTAELALRHFVDELKAGRVTVTEEQKTALMSLCARYDEERAANGSGHLAVRKSETEPTPLSAVLVMKSELPEPLIYRLTGFGYFPEKHERLTVADLWEAGAHKIAGLKQIGAKAVYQIAKELCRCGVDRGEVLKWLSDEGKHRGPLARYYVRDAKELFIADASEPV